MGEMEKNAQARKRQVKLGKAVRTEEDREVRETSGNTEKQRNIVSR